MNFLAECSPRIMATLKIFEGTHSPVAVSAFNLMEELSAYLMSGTAKVSGFGTATDEFLDEMTHAKKMSAITDFHDAFLSAFQKFSKHWDAHQARKLYQEICIFDPRQAPSLPSSLESYSMPILAEPSAELREEWPIYINLTKNEPLPDPFDLADFWKGLGVRLPQMTTVASQYLYFPVSSVYTERSFSKYKTLLTDKRESLTEVNTKMLVIMNHNGDVSDRWKE